MSTLQWIPQVLRLTRAWNLLILALAQYATAVCLMGSHTFTDWRLLVLVISTVMIAAGGYVINDYYDVKIDFINRPNRVVVGKTIHRRFAILLHGVLSMAGIGLGFALGWRIGVIHLLSVSLLWYYSNLLKRLPFVGNLAVSVLTGVSLLMLNVLYDTFNQLVIIYAVFAFFMTLIREIIKDMEDVKGDTTYGCKTLPIVWGMRKSKLVVYSLLGIFIVVVGLINIRYAQLQMIYFAMFLFVPAAWLSVQLSRADTVRDYAWLSSLCKMMMLLGILSMVLVRQ
jgi:4-hydroxybenzoate polyprenyltransferase